MKKRIVEIITWGMNQLARIKRKKIMTPRLIVQNEISFRNVERGALWFFIRAKITDILISEIGKEKPRKNVSKVSFSRVNQWVYSLFTMARLEITNPQERQSNEA